MPVEQADNTRVELPPRIVPPKPGEVRRINLARLLQAQLLNLALLWDADKIKKI